MGAERRLVVLEIGEDAAARGLNSPRRLGRQGDNGTALEEPYESGLIVAGKALVARRRPFWRRMKAEQLPARPAQYLGLLAPRRQEMTGAHLVARPLQNWQSWL